jgi:hypothetical protein
MMWPRQAYAHVFHQEEGVSRAASARWMLLAVATLPVNARGLLLLSLARTAAGSMLTAVHPVFLSSSPPSVAATYLAQTHVLTPDSPYFKLVGGRPALLKVQLTGSGSSPGVSATVTAKSEETMTLTLTGPNTLSSFWNGDPGQVEHKFDDSFTAIIPAEWVAHGMRIEVHADGKSHAQYELAVGAPSAMRMLMFDVHYFGTGSGDVRQHTTL